MIKARPDILRWADAADATALRVRSAGVPESAKGVAALLAGDAPIPQPKTKWVGSAGALFHALWSSVPGTPPARASQALALIATGLRAEDTAVITRGMLALKGTELEHFLPPEVIEAIEARNAPTDSAPS